MIGTDGAEYCLTALAFLPPNALEVLTFSLGKKAYTTVAPAKIVDWMFVFPSIVTE